MKILQLTPQFIFPPDDGGRIGIYNITRELQELGADVTMVSLNTSQPEFQTISISEKQLPVYSIHHSTKNSIPRILYSVFDTEPLYLRKHFSKRILDKLLLLLKGKSFDIIHADHTAMIPLALELRKHLQLPVGVRMHNVEWKIWQRYADELPKTNPSHYYIQLQTNRLRKRETELLRMVDVAFPITEVDMNLCKDMAPLTRLELVAAGVDSKEWIKSVETQRNPHELVLATPWSWKHNLTGALWFIEEVLPLIRKEVPECTLTLLGKNAPRELYTMKDSGVDCLGYVDSVKPYYHRASLYIAPLFVGSGVRIKVLEAMAAGLPVVATPIAAEGINASDTEGLLRCNDAEAFAATIINLLHNQQRLVELGLAASTLMARQYQWKESIQHMYNTYLNLTKLKR